METTIDINHIFPERITVLDQNLIASRKSSGRSDPQPQIAAVIDELGRASAKAQHLTAPITSASKLQTNKHHLYLIKDGESKGGKGLVVGFLKVGYKKLFLLDQRGAHVETEPLCVLDFFVKEDLQRHGYGLELFEFMLQHKKVDPVMMAFDRPSPKFLSFLEKHYCLKNSVPQVNNFVVFDGFFANRSAVRSRKVPPKKPDGEIKPYSLTEREALREEQRALPWPMSRPAPPPPSPPLSGSSLCSPNRGRQRPDPALAPALANAPGGYRSPTLRSPLTDSLHSREKRTRSVHISLPPLSRKELLPASLAIREPGRQADKDARPRRGVGVGEESRPPRGGEGGPLEGEEKRERGRGNGGWSWTVGESRCNAQWVRQNQDRRSTRPW